MSSIRVYLDPEESRFVDVAEGYTMLIGDENVLEVYDDVDVVLAMFRTWDHAVSLDMAVLLPVLTIPQFVDPEDEEDDEDDEDLEEDDEDDEEEEEDEEELVEVVNEDDVNRG